MERLQAGEDRFVCGINLRSVLVREGRPVSSVVLVVVNLKLGSARILSVMTNTGQLKLLATGGGYSKQGAVTAGVRLGWACSPESRLGHCHSASGGFRASLG